MIISTGDSSPIEIDIPAMTFSGRRVKRSATGRDISGEIALVVARSLAAPQEDFERA